MRGLVGRRSGCAISLGTATATRPQSFPHGCLVPGCPGAGGRSHAAATLRASLRLQDELHLLRDSLGAVDSHYESILDHLQHELGASRGKIAASSATLTGYDRQVDVLYRRTGRVFPQPGPRAGESFWSRRPPRFCAGLWRSPRGVTLEFVSDRTTNILQEAVRMLLDETGQDSHSRTRHRPVHAEDSCPCTGQTLSTAAPSTTSKPPSEPWTATPPFDQQRAAHRPDRLRRRPRNPGPAREP